MKLLFGMPLVQCLTNSVVMEITSNVLLAAGATPAMIDTPEEAGDFATVSNAVLINTGTPSSEQYEGMRAAIAGANRAGVPWVMDPVGAGGLAHRTAFLVEMLEHNPSVIRGNASEIQALAGIGSGGRGVDSTMSTEDALPSAQLLATKTGGVIAISGAQDVIVSAGKISRVTSGDPILQKVIGTGCSLGALCAAYASLPGVDTHEAVVTAHAHTGAAAQIAIAKAAGPGTFVPHWLDALSTITEEEISRLVSIEESQWI